MEKRPYNVPEHAKKVFQGEIFSIWQWEQELYDGTTAIFERASRPDAAFVLVVLPDKRLMLIKDTQPHRGPIITLPGGKVEKGEDPLGAAKRELLEETGYACKTYTPWFTFSHPGKVSYAFHYFIGHEARQIQEAQPEAGEKIELRPHTFDEFITLFSSNDHDNIYATNMLTSVVHTALAHPEKMKAFKTLLYSND